MTSSNLGWREVVRRTGRLVFGDRTGLALWLGMVVGLGLTWRVGFFITDTYTVANTLVNVAQGRLAVTEVRYSLSLLSQPGLHEVGGQLYGRNYGQVFLTVPIVYALQVLQAAAPLHVVLASGWSLALVGLTHHLGVLWNRLDVRVAGGVIALSAFVVNVRGGTALDPVYLHLLALQLGTVVAGAFAGVCFYRLIDVFHDRRIAVAAGVSAVGALPLGVWATFPKRHVLVTALVVAAIYSFARSRQANGRRAYVALGGAYVFASLITWVHAFEGFFVLAALAGVDVVTGGMGERRRIAIIGLALLIGLGPMLMTNAAIGGNPLEPPRVLPNHGSGGVELAPSGEVQGANEGGSGRSGGTGSMDVEGDRADDGGGAGSERVDSGEHPGGAHAYRSASVPLAMPGGVSEEVAELLDQLEFIWGFVGATLVAGIEVLGKPDRLFHIFVRSGRIASVDYSVNQYEVIELTVLESAPLLGGLLALPAVVATRLREEIHRDGWRRRRALTPARQTDLLVTILAVLFTLVYLSRLPLLSQITVRYLLPTFPLFLYGVVRLAPVRSALGRVPRRLGFAYGWGVLAGLVGVTAVLSTLDVALGEAMQFHALVNLGVAVTLGVLVAGRTVVPHRVPLRWVADALAVAGGATTTLLVLMGVEYFRYGAFAIALGRYLSDLIPIF